MAGLLAILFLFGGTQVVFMVTSRFRSERMRILDNALTRQVLLASVRRELDNLHKQVMVTSQIQSDDPTMIGAPESRQQVNQGLAKVRQELARIKELTEPAEQGHVDELWVTSSKLADSWTTFYQYLGKDSATATASLITADPLARQVLDEQIPRLEKAEKQRALKAEQEFQDMERTTEQATWIILVATTLILVAGHHLMSSYLTRTVQVLQDGAIMIGHGDLEHRIDVKSKDELGRLAQAFNEMSENLMKAQGNLLDANKQLEQRTAQIEEQQKLSDRLLLNILPTEVALELQSKGSVEPRYFEDVTILFTDFVGFTTSTENLAAEELVQVLHEYFTTFDIIVAKYGLEKLKTIGDSYMCVGGMPARTPSHAVDAVMAAFEMVHYVTERERQDGVARWAVRIGIHTGPVVAGVVGIRKFAFDIWGDSVNFASRMESSGAPNRINISAATQMRVKDFFAHETRGKIETKDKREVDMFFVQGVLPSLLNGSKRVPPERFEKRYRAYFQKDMTAFPEFLIERSEAAEGA